jgi:GAF domain-containing protein
VEPVPETREALSQLSTDHEDADLVDGLVELGRAAREIVPELMGMSLAIVKEGLTFTLVATGSEVAQVDAAQYLDGGPCLRDSGNAEAVGTTVSDLLDEHRWSLFARASAAVGVQSSLSLSLVKEGLVVGGINLYASTPDAFTGLHEEMAAALGADAHSAVTNADLSFSSRLEAARAPSRLRDRDAIDQALGILAARYGESVDDARTRLGRAAARAGLAQAVVARMLLDLHMS